MTANITSNCKIARISVYIEFSRQRNREVNGWREDVPTLLPDSALSKNNKTCIIHAIRSGADTVQWLGDLSEPRKFLTNNEVSYAQNTERLT